MSQQTTPDPDWRTALRDSQLFVLLWSADPREAPRQQQRLTYAMQLGKPIRLLVRPGRRVPENLCAGYADLQVAHAETPEASAAYVRRWLAELPEERKDV